ncbi:MAG: hypothetical protein JXB15_11120 [Anaerolineales bacterium]|nr:hypothetical protein [Anaerolineales bacterium]
MKSGIVFKIVANLAILALLFVTFGAGVGDLQPQSVLAAAGDDPSPPAEIVKLIFIHHSCGENWLQDDYGRLGVALAHNNYFVSDTNYGWGPDSIGDRTDIYNWPEWFTGPDSQRYLSALYAESGQNSSYTRLPNDPGGENQVVMFKSCYPNSELEGSPNDGPDPNEGMTVGHAKFVYNQLLTYFITRPDKLFVVITAPPVQDRGYADNARAFTTWLMQDWLRENNYPYPNVAVFDFYNVLTHADNHHHFVNGQVEWITDHGNNTLRYPSDDNHPSIKGSRKATEEFLPLLNVFYHRWRGGGALPPAPPTEGPAEVVPTMPGEEIQPTLPPGQLQAGGLIDDLEGDAPAETDGWQTNLDESTPTRVDCGPERGLAHGGSQALHIDYEIAANSWANCGLFYWSTRDWRPAQGISLFVHASQSGQTFDVTVFGGSPDALETYQFKVEITPAMVEGWVRLEYPWSELRRVEWEANPGAPFDPARAAGFAIGFDTFPDTPNVGELWVDDVQLIGMGAPPQVEIEATEAPEEEPEEEPEVEEPEEEEQEDENGGFSLPCMSPAAFLALVAILYFWAKKKIY